MRLPTKHPALFLRSFAFEYAPILAQLANNFEISKQLRDSFPHPYLLQDGVDFIQLCVKNEQQSILAIEYKGVLVGSIGLHVQKDVETHGAELGYFIGEPYWGQNLVSAAVEKMCSFGFETLHLQRIYASVFEGNNASMRVLEKNGFRVEEIKKQAIFRNQVYLDEFFYVKLHV